MPEILRTSSHPDARNAANLLSDLHGDRIKADYRLSQQKSETMGFAQISVETALEIAKSNAAHESTYGLAADRS